MDKVVPFDPVARVDLARNLRAAKMQFDAAVNAVDRATALLNDQESEVNAATYFNEYKSSAQEKSIGQLALDKHRGQLNASLARAQSAAKTRNDKEVAYNTAKQRYGLRLDVDSNVKFGVHPRIFIDVRVDIDGVLQPDNYRFDSSFNLVKTNVPIPNANVNESMKDALRKLDDATLDRRPQSVLDDLRNTIDGFKRNVSASEALLYAPLHAVRKLDEFKSPTRITPETIRLNAEHDKLYARGNFAAARLIQEKLKSLTYTDPDSTNVVANIGKLLHLLFDDNVMFNGKSYVASGHEWLKASHVPFGFQVRRRPTELRVVNPVPTNLSTYNTLLAKYAEVIHERPVADVVAHEAEKEIEEFFISAEQRVQVGGDGMSNLTFNVIVALFNITTGANLPPVYISSGGIPLETTAPPAEPSATTFSEVRDEAIALTGSIYHHVRPEPINPYAIFEFVLSSWTQYGRLKDINWNNHIGRYVRAPTQQGKCRAFIYEYLAYRVSIYSDFFSTTRYSGYSDLPLMVDTRKNSDLIRSLMTTAFHPLLQNPLSSLLAIWTDHDTRVYQRAAKLQHYDAVLLRFLCREVLLRTLTETACAINILSVALMVRNSKACAGKEKRDAAMNCLTELHNTASRLLDGTSTAATVPLKLPLAVEEPILERPEFVATPVYGALLKKQYKVNGASVVHVDPKCEPVPQKAQLSSGEYVDVLAKSVETMKAKPDLRLYVSFMHAPPCASLTQRVLVSKLELYQERMADMHKYAADKGPEKVLANMKQLLGGHILNSAKDILSGIVPKEDLKFEYEPQLIQNLTEFKCKTHTPPKFDEWYADLDRLHAAYADELRALYPPVEKLVRVVHDLYRVYDTKDSFELFNQVDYVVTAYNLVADACAITYSDIDITPSARPQNQKSARNFLSTIIDLVNGVKRVVAPPPVTLAKMKSQENTDAILMMLRKKKSGRVTRAELETLNLHMPMRLSAKQVWREFKRLLALKGGDEGEKRAIAFLEHTDFKSNAFAAHQLLEQVETMIKARQYTAAITALKTIFSLNVYKYDWAQFYKLHTLKEQRDHLTFLLEDMTEAFKGEMNAFAEKQIEADLKNLQNENPYMEATLVGSPTDPKIIATRENMAARKPMAAGPFDEKTTANIKRINRDLSARRDDPAVQAKLIETSEKKISDNEAELEKIKLSTHPETDLTLPREGPLPELEFAQTKELEEDIGVEQTQLEKIKRLTSRTDAVNLSDASAADVKIIAEAYRKALERRSGRMHHYLYVLNTVIGNKTEADKYKNESNVKFSAYTASKYAIQTGQSVYDIRAQFQEDQSSIPSKLLALVKGAEPCNARTAFLLQFDPQKKWSDDDVDYKAVLELLSPDHPVNRLVQHVSTALFPDETNIEKARDLVANMLDAYRSSQFDQARTVDRAVVKAAVDATTLSKAVDEQVATFAPNPNLQKAVQYLNRSVLAKENLWPGKSDERTLLERATDITYLTDNLPYLDGEYTLNIVARVHLLSEGNDILKLKNKPDKTCVDKKQEARLLKDILYGRAEKGLKHIGESIAKLFETPVKPPEVSKPLAPTPTQLVPGSNLS